MMYSSEQFTFEFAKWKQKFMSKCDKCSDGYVIGDKKYNTWAECECVKQARMHAHLVCSGIPQGYLLGEYQWNLKRKFDKQCKEYAESFSSHYLDDGKGLYLYGGSGSGKTTMAVLIAKEISLQRNKYYPKRFYKFAFYSFDELISLYLKTRFNNDACEKYEYAINTSDLLIIDGVGLEKEANGNNMARQNVQLMKIILDKRENSKLPFILISHMDLQSFSTMYEKSSYDLVKKNCDIVLVNGNNFRKTTSADELLGDF